MSVHEDLLNNGENNCSFTEDEVDIMCSKDGDDACGDGSIDVKSEPLGSLYNDKKSEKNSGWRSSRSLHVINDNSYCRALFNQLVDVGV